MASEKEMIQAWREGTKLTGVPRDDNPYDHDTEPDRHDAWDRGWLATHGSETATVEAAGLSDGDVRERLVLSGLLPEEVAR